MGQADFILIELLGKSVVVEHRELVHGFLPISACTVPISRDVAQCQPDQLGGRIIRWEVPACLDDLAQPGVNALDGVGGVDHPPDVRREGEERNHRVCCDVVCTCALGGP
jgi:hypothetical protein